ncbi:translocase [Aquicoccus sp. SCR17]|nr:translocase [Carideicomes alvinocaridis]
MLQTNRYVMAGISVACALGIGFIMQGGLDGLLGGGDTPTRRIVTEAPATVSSGDRSGAAQPDPEAPAVQITRVERTANAPAPRDPDTPAQLATPGPRETSTSARAPDASPDAQTRPTAAAQEECSVGMEAEPQAAATVALSLDAPCQPNARVTIHHNGMMFTDVTDADGNLSLTVPALASQAVFIAALDNSEGAVAMADVPSLDRFDRIVLQWKGQEGIELHAMEFSDDYDGPGHVWSKAERSPEAAESGEGGFLVTLGDAGMDGALQAEVYTFPAAATKRSGDVDMSVEAEVTEGNCGKEIEAQTIEVHRGTAPRVQDVTVFVPDCDAVGDFLVLKNLIEDLKIASN